MFSSVGPAGAVAGGAGGQNNKVMGGIRIGW